VTLDYITSFHITQRITENTMDVSNILVLLMYLSGMAALVGAFMWYRKRKLGGEDGETRTAEDVARDIVRARAENDQENGDAQQAQEQGRGRGGRGRGGRGGNVRNRRRRRLDVDGAGPGGVVAGEGIDSGDDDHKDIDDGEDGEDLSGMTKAQRKQHMKLKKKAEKQAMKQAQRQAISDQGARKSAKAERESEYEAARERREQERLAEQQRLEDEKKRKEEEQYNEWVGAFSVEDTGSVEQLTAEESQGLLQQFVDYIEQRKVVELDELAAEFSLKTAEVVERIKQLEESDMLTGVLDDRGKYIFITPQEFQQVAAFIKRRGRVSISDIVAESNKLINLAEAG
jgi:DDRGK domain-containing protein 1